MMANLSVHSQVCKHLPTLLSLFVDCVKEAPYRETKLQLLQGLLNLCDSSKDEVRKAVLAFKADDLPSLTKDQFVSRSIQALREKLSLK